MIPRFVEDLFGLKEYLKDYAFDVKVSFFEIYNEQIFDLLNEGTLKALIQTSQI